MDETSLTSPGDVQGDIVRGATAKDEEADHDGPKPGPESRIVIACATPGWEAVAEKVVISLPSWAFQNFGNNTESGVAIAGDIDGFLDLRLAWRLVGVDSWFALVAKERFFLLGIALRDEGLLRFVRVYETGFLSVGLRDVFLRGRRRDSEETVECGV